MKLRPIFLKAKRQDNGLAFTEVEVGWLHGWLIRLFKPRGWWVAEVAWDRTYPAESQIIHPRGRIGVEPLKQLTVWAETGRAPNVIVKNYRDSTEAVIGKDVKKKGKPKG